MARLTSELILSLMDRVSGPARGVARSLDSLRGKTRASSMGLARNERVTGKMASAMGMYARSAAAAAAPLAGGFAAADTLKTAANFETAMTQIGKKGGIAGAELEKVKQEILGIAESGRVAMDPQEIAGAYERGIAAGLPLDQMKEFTILSAQAADAWDMGSAETGNAFAGFQTSLGLATKDARKYADLINTLADSGISDEKDIVSFVDRSGAQLKMLGLNNEQIAAYGASMLNLKMPAEVASRAMNTLSTKMLTPKATKPSRKAFAQLYGDADAFTTLLKKDANGAILDFYHRLQKLDKFKQAEILSGILGQGFSDEITRVVAALPELERNLAITMKPELYVGSLERGYQAKLNSLEGRWKVFKANLEKLQIDLGDLIIAPAGGFLSEATKAANDLSGALKGIRSTYDALHTAVTGQAPSGDFGPSRDWDDPTGNLTQIRADRIADQTKRDLADKAPSSGAVGSFGARDMEGVTTGNALAYTTKKVRRFIGDTPMEKVERDYQTTRVLGHRDAERTSMQKMKEQYGADLTPNGQAFRPGTDAQSLVDDALAQFANTVLLTAQTISKATGQATTADGLARAAGIPPIPTPRPERAIPIPTDRPDTVTSKPIEIPITPKITENGRAAIEAQIREIDQRLGSLSNAASSIVPGAGAAEVVRSAADEMQKLMDKRDELDARLNQPMAATKPTIDTSSMDAAISKADHLISKLQSIPGHAAAASRASAQATATQASRQMGREASAAMRNHFSDGGT